MILTLQFYLKQQLHDKTQELEVAKATMKVDLNEANLKDNCQRSFAICMNVRSQSN